MQARARAVRAHDYTDTCTSEACKTCEFALRCAFVCAVVLLLALATSASAEEPPLILGVDADLSGATAETGRAIVRGCELAIQEINANGGVLGRELALQPMDHRGNPARGRIISTTSQPIRTCWQSLAASTHQLR